MGRRGYEIALHHAPGAVLWVLQGLLNRDSVYVLKGIEDFLLFRRGHVFDEVNNFVGFHVSNR